MDAKSNKKWLRTDVAVRVVFTKIVDDHVGKLNIVTSRVFGEAAVVFHRGARAAATHIFGIRDGPAQRVVLVLWAAWMVQFACTEQYGVSKKVAQSLSISRSVN